jgi:ligand-binding SRPBCC domain-containing protein
LANRLHCNNEKDTAPASLPSLPIPVPVFTRSTLVPAPPEALFRFHENPHNLRRISPPGLRILDIRAAETARPGEEFTVAVRQAPLTLRWTGRWETVTPPGLLVDTGVKCPFARWRHHHIFAPHPDGSMLTDRVEFRLPWHLGGPFGDLVCRHLVFPRMFAARHAATRRHFAVP